MQSVSFQEYLRRKSVPWDSNSVLNSPIKGTSPDTNEFVKKSPFSNYQQTSEKKQNRFEVNSENLIEEKMGDSEEKKDSPFSAIRISEEKEYKKVLSDNQNLDSGEYISFISKF